MIFFDTETLGLCGPIVLLQWAKNEGPIHLESLWLQTIEQNLNRFEQIINDPVGVVGFNLSFDWFHVCQMYTTLLLMKDKKKKLIDCVNEYVENEPLARDGPCCKPKASCDLFLLARRTEYQSTMDRKNVRIKKVPNQLAYLLAEELEKRVKFKDIYFARRKKDLGGRRWEVEDNQDRDFKDIVLKFKASSALKALAIDALGMQPDKTLFYDDISHGKIPDEHAYAPFAKAVKKGTAWPELIDYCVAFWASNEQARRYAEDDVIYTRKLYHYFDDPDLGDTDSELACMVGACRWKGYKIDIEKLTKLRNEIKAALKVDEFDPNHVPTAPTRVKPYLQAVMSPEERLGLVSTNKKTLNELAKGPLWVGTEVSERAKKVIAARDMKYHLDLYNKLLIAGRFHVDTNVAGTLSGRMSGGTYRENKRGKKGSINPQGIPRDDYVRECFILAHEGTSLCGGDMESFEVALAAAAYKDENLTKDLSLCWMCNYEYKSSEFIATKCPQCGKSDGKDNTRTKIHGLFGMALFPGKSYIEVRKSKGQEPDMYDLGKRGVFSTVYGGNEKTLETRLEIPIEIAKEAIDRFLNRYPGVRRAQQKTYENFCSMRQPGGIGSKVTWAEPADYAESMLGYRRFFTLENRICKALFDLGENPPKEWLDLKIKVVRRDRSQFVGNAVRSALFGAAFGIQSHNMRAAGNHVIQSTGAQITKEVQKTIWDLQPTGIQDWIVQPFQVHDEVMVPVHPDYVKKVTKVVLDKVETYRSKVPLIAIGWKENISNWKEK